MFRFGSVAVLLGAILCVGCSQHKPPQGGPRLKTSPVIGIVQVDGATVEGLLVECHPEPGLKIQYAVTTATDAKGKFSPSTYESGDGLPEGTYSLVFMWLEPGMIGKEPVDKLKGAYSDPKKSTHKVTVKAGEKCDLGVIELSAKGPG